MSPKEVARRKVGAAAMSSRYEAGQLELEEIQDEDESQLVARGAAYVRAFGDVEKQPTILAINIATVLLALRKKHDDWQGRTYAYRQVATEMYNRANLPADQAERLRSNVRWHIGNLLRRHLTPREFKGLDLLDASPLERLQDRRATNNIILSAVKASAEVTGSTPSRSVTVPAGSSSKQATKKVKDAEVVPEQSGSSGVKATADHLRLAFVAANIVEQLSPDVVREDMTDGQREKLDGELARIQAHVTKLRKLTKAPRSKT